MRDLFVSVNGLRLHVADAGGDGLPVLFVHGTGMVGQVWEPAARALGPGFRPLLLDRRGHGDSDKPPAGYQWADNAVDIAGVVRALGIEGCAGVGHSSGGTALVTAASDHPGLFSRVALIDPILMPRRAAAGSGSPMSERTRRRRSEWPSAEAMVASLRAKFPYNGWREDALWAYVRRGTAQRPDGSVALKCPPELEALMYQHDGTLDVFAKLAALRCPLLIVRAGNTDRFPRENAERARTVTPGCTLVELPGVTHFAPMEQPEAIAGLLRAFLLDQPTPGSGFDCGRRPDGP